MRSATVTTTVPGRSGAASIVYSGWVHNASLGYATAGTATFTDSAGDAATVTANAGGMSTVTITPAGGSTTTFTVTLS